MRAALLLIVLCGASEVFAIPAFARKYETACSTCHADVWPALNAFGRLVKENGYQYPAGAEAVARERGALQPGAPGERLQVLRELPLAVRATGSARLSPDPIASGRSGMDLRPLESLRVLVGAAVWKDVSFFAAADVVPRAQLHHAAVGVHNLLGEGTLSLRAGRFLLLDFLRPEHRELTGAGNPAATVRVGLNPAALDDSHLGIDAYGRWRRLFFEVALLQGALAGDGLSDRDSYKDLFGQLQLSFQPLTFGALGYLGRAQLLDTAHATAVRFTDRFWRAGAHAELDAGPVTLFALLVRGRHEDPLGTGRGAGYWGVRLELDAHLNRELLAIIRYDAVSSPDAPALERSQVTTHLTFLALTHFKVSAEYLSMLHDLNQSMFRFVIDLAL